MTHSKHTAGPWTHYVIAQYAYATYERGDIISRHKSYEAAARAIKGNSFARIAHREDFDAMGYPAISQNGVILMQEGK